MNCWIHQSNLQNYASNLVAEGLDLETIRQRMGHGTLSVTDRYIMKIKDDLNFSAHEIAHGNEKGDNVSKWK
jgi:site-specific recombinase XerD